MLPACSPGMICARPHARALYSSGVVGAQPTLVSCAHPIQLYSCVVQTLRLRHMRTAAGGGGATHTPDMCETAYTWKGARSVVIVPILGLAGPGRSVTCRALDRLCRARVITVFGLHLA